MPISVRAVEPSQIGGAAAAGNAPRERASRAAAERRRQRAFMGSSQGKPEA
jgi:hypothetical protein